MGTLRKAVVNGQTIDTFRSDLDVEGRPWAYTVTRPDGVIVATGLARTRAEAEDKARASAQEAGAA